MPKVGLTTSNIRIKLPEGATDVKALKSPSRLSYQLSMPSSETARVACEFDVEAKPQIMSGLAKAMSNRRFAALWTARSTFKNTGTAVLGDYRFRLTRVSQFSAAKSVSSPTETLFGAS
jgi:hypothetical protein